MRTGLAIAGMVSAALVLPASAATPVGPDPIEPHRWSIPAFYPPDSLRDKARGVVAFEIAVGSDGVPSGCTVSERSGDDLVDVRTCEWLVKQARFKPARDADGKAVAGHFETRFGWTVRPGGLAPLPTAGSLTLTAMIEADGRVTDCEVERSGMRAGDPFDAWCGELVNFEPPVDARGKKARRRLVLKRSLSYEDIPED